MKKIMFLSIMFFGFGLLKAQQSQSYSIVPMQAGTINLNSGTATLNLSDEIKIMLNDASLSATYYIVFTPLEDAPLPSVSNKSNTSFTVLAKLNSEVKASGINVDYIVFVKRKVQAISTKKIGGNAAIQN